MSVQDQLSPVAQAYPQQVKAHVSADWSALQALRYLVVTAGLAWSILFIWLGLQFDLQTYGDGSIFSYAVAVTDSWAMHWHNIAPRLTVYVMIMLPSEAVVRVTGHPSLGIMAYGALFYGTQIMGLLATFHWDRSDRKSFFCFACASVAILDPLVFGAPSEVWVAHALFWPACVYAIYQVRSRSSACVLMLLMIALVLCHEAAIPFGALIVAAVFATRSNRSQRRFVLSAFLMSVFLWSLVKLEFPPDQYYGAVLTRAALNFFNPSLVVDDLIRLELGALVAYAICLLLCFKLKLRFPVAVASGVTLAALCCYWLLLDHSLHAESRYYMRTILALGTLGLGLLAVMFSGPFDPRQTGNFAYLAQVRALLSRRFVVASLTGAFLCMLCINLVETGKFLTAWRSYKQGLTALADGVQADANLGDPRFVSSKRLPANLNRLAWFSTTPYLGIILSDFHPRHLPIDPSGNYFWLACSTATQNAQAHVAVPADARDLIRIYSCLHRRD